MDTFSQFGNILIGAVVVVHSGFVFQLPTFQEEPKPVSCTGFHIRYYRDVLGLMFAVDEINNSPELLPNISLGFRLLDSCMSELRAVGGVLSLLSGLGNPFPGYDCHTFSVMVGIVGEHFSALSLPIAQMLSALHYPQISHGATLSALSNKINFPSFLRTMPSNLFQNIALIQLIGRFGWTWVGMLVVDNDSGQQGAQVIQAGIESNGGCVAFLEKIHLSYSDKQIKRVVDVIKGSSINVIILHSPEVHMKALLDAMFYYGVTGKIFISSASFIITPGLFSKKAWKVLNGTIGLVPSAASMPGFEHFLLNLHPNASSRYPFIRLFWEKAFSCRWPIGYPNGERFTTPIIKEDETCTGGEELRSDVSQLFETNDLSLTYHAYLAVYAYAHALHSLLNCPSVSEGYFSHVVCANINDAQPWKVLRYLKKTNFHTKSGEVMKFNSVGDLPASYDIMNIQILNDCFNLVKVGRIDPEAKLADHRCHSGKDINNLQALLIYTFLLDADECTRCPSDQWTNEERDRCIPKVIEFLSYDEPLGVTLVITIVIFSVLTFCILITFIKYRDTPIIKATNRELSYILLVSLILCFLCCLVFIGQPSTLSCLLRQTFFSVAFSISISSVLAKTIMVIIAFKATSPNSPLRKWLGPAIPRNVVGLCLVFQMSICSIWLYRSPPFPALNTQNYKITFECNEGQKFFFYMTLGFMGFLAMVSFLVAFLARNLPGSFNEAKLITFSMLVFCSVWISFIPAYLSTSGKYTVAVQIFAILASSAGLLNCIFLPKCYIILVRPERNNREFLSGFGQVEKYATLIGQDDTNGHEQGSPASPPPPLLAG
ncbi:extracellular calcium-sensing receptor-like [Mantella aurantiaca]